MSVVALGFIIASASLHVFWNAIVKSCQDKVSFIFLSTCVGTLTAILLFLGVRIFLPGPLTVEIAGLAALSGFIEALYLITLFAAYNHVDLSVAYPLSRGTAPLVALVPGVWLLGDALTQAQFCGVVIVFCGVLAVSVSAAKSGQNSRRVAVGILLALLTGTLIAAYHLVDRKAMTHASRVSSLEYFAMMHTALFGFITCGICVVPSFRRRALAEWKGNRSGVILVGVLSVFAYVLVIAALRLANVTLVAATRNIGIVISTVVGGFLLRERVGRGRVIGSLLIVLGIVIVVLLGDDA